MEENIAAFRAWLDDELDKARFALEHQTMEYLTLAKHTERVETLETVKAAVDRLLTEEDKG